MSEEQKPPFRACTICAGLAFEAGVSSDIQARYVVSIHEVPDHRPTQFFCCEEHKNADACRHWANTMYDQAVVSFELFSEFWKRVCIEAEAKQAVATLKAVPRDEL